MTEKLVSLLEEALQNPSRRSQAIDEFQRIVWLGECSSADEHAEEIFDELAYDLDFYEPDPKARREDSSYFGNDRVVEEITLALEKLRALGISIHYARQ